MIVGRTGPKHPILGNDSLIRHSRIVSYAAGGRSTEFCKHLGVVGTKILTATESVGQSLDDLQIGPDGGRRLLGATPEKDAAFEVGHGALLLSPLRHREDDICEFRGFGQ